MRATLLCLLLIVLFVAGFLGIIYAQVASLAKDWPRIQQKLQQGLATAQQWVEQRFDLDPKQQVQAARQQLTKFTQSSDSSLTMVLSGLTGLLADFVLVLLYVFFLYGSRKNTTNFS